MATLERSAMSEPSHIHRIQEEPIQFLYEQQQVEFRCARCSVCGHWIIITETAKGQCHRQATGIEDGLCFEIWCREIWRAKREGDEKP